MPESAFPVEVIGGVPVVAAPEEIDIMNAPDLRAALLDVASDGHGQFVVDMTRTRYCDSSGVYALAMAHRRAAEEGGQLLLAVSGAAVLRILALTRLDQVIPNFATLDEALGHAVPADESQPLGQPRG